MMRLPDAYDLKYFYNTVRGRIVRKIIREKILAIWPDLSKQTLFGYGYAMPYLKPFLNEHSLTANIMPAQLGVHNWPVDEKNLVCFNAENLIPLETNSVDRIIMIHALEFLDDPEGTFAEIWRVLKSTGRIIVVVPNRMGLWARVDSSPLGQGQPYSARQVEHFLKENLYVHERTEYTLFTPPFNKALPMQLANIFEKVGEVLFPALGGVHIIEASKQIYAQKGKGAPARVKKAIKSAIPAGKPVASPRHN